MDAYAPRKKAVSTSPDRLRHVTPVDWRPTIAQQLTSTLRSMAEGSDSMAEAHDSMAEGSDSMAEGSDSMAEGSDSMAEGPHSMAEASKATSEDSKGMPEVPKRRHVETQCTPEAAAGMSRRVE